MHAGAHPIPWSEATAAVFLAVFERLLPPALPGPLRCAEVFAIAPERFDPFAAGWRMVHPFPHEDALPHNRAYPIRATWSVVQTTEVELPTMLRVYVGPVEWRGRDYAEMEGGLSVDGHGAAHWVWRLGRVDGIWSVLRCELVWRR